LILRPASDNAQFMRPAIVNRFPAPGLKEETQRFTWIKCSYQPVV